MIVVLVVATAVAAAVVVAVAKVVVATAAVVTSQGLASYSEYYWALSVLALSHLSRVQLKNATKENFPENLSRQLEDSGTAVKVYTPHGKGHGLKSILIVCHVM